MLRLGSYHFARLWLLVGLVSISIFGLRPVYLSMVVPTTVSNLTLVAVGLGFLTLYTTLWTWGGSYQVKSGAIKGVLPRYIPR